MLLRAVPGGGLHCLQQGDQQGADDRGSSPAAGTRGMLQRARHTPAIRRGRGPPDSGRRGAGGLLEGVGRRADTVTDQGRGVLGGDG